MNRAEDIEAAHRIVSGGGQLAKPPEGMGMNAFIVVLLLVAQPEFMGEVVKVYDGDTCLVETVEPAAVHRIRLRWVDAPELKQAGGLQARDWLGRLALGKVVFVRPYSKSWDRIVAEVLIDGRSINSGLVKAGHAWCDLRYDPPKFIQDLQEEASLKRRGLWMERRPVAPWTWRHAQKKPAKEAA